MFSKKKRKESLKIQEVSTDCPSYDVERDSIEKMQGEETSEKKKSKKTKRQRKSKMRNVRKKRRNPLVIALIFILAVAGAAAGFYFYGIPLLGGSSIVHVEKVSNIMGLGSGNGSLNRYAGIVESQGEWSIKVEGSKIVKEVYVTEGDKVETGDKLFAYDAEAMKLSLDQAKLELERMESELAAVQSQISSLESQKQYASSGEQLDIEIQIQSLKANSKKTEYEIKKQKVSIEDLEESLENTIVVSELSGVVKSIDQSVVNGNAFGDTNFITILATGDYRVRASVNEQNQWSIEDGAKVIVCSRVDSSVKWTGTIITVDTQNPEDSDSASYSDAGELITSSSYPFYVKLDSSDGLLLGQHVYVELDQGQDEKKEGVWLAGYYLVQDDNKTFVWARSRFNLLEKRELQLGEFNEVLGQYQILSGLSRDDYIAFPVEGMFEGARTTKETEAGQESTGVIDNEKEDFQSDDNMFQEFDSEEKNNTDGDDLGPVGSIGRKTEGML